MWPRYDARAAIMIDALIAGRVYGKPASRVSKAGNTFAVAKVRTPMANGESTFVNVIAFSNTTIGALLTLADADSVAIAAELKVGTYTDKDGAPRPSLDLTAHAVLSEYDVQRKRKAVAEARE